MLTRPLYAGARFKITPPRWIGVPFFYLLIPSMRNTRAAMDTDIVRRLKRREGVFFVVYGRTWRP